VIVSYDYDVVTLYVVRQELNEPSDVNYQLSEGTQNRLVWRDGVVVVETPNGYYTLQGEKIL
jgi:hypothetical protein